MSSPLPARLRLVTAAHALVIPPLLSLVSLDRVAARFGRLHPFRAGAEDERVAAYVDGLLGRLPRPWRRTCLRRAVVLYCVLRRRGRDVRLCIGVRRDAVGELAAHAWVELAGEPYLEDGAERVAEYEPIAVFPEPS